MLDQDQEVKDYLPCNMRLWVHILELIIRRNQIRLSNWMDRQ